MLWSGISGSSNVDDRRGMSAGGIATGGGLVGLVVYLLYSFLGGDPSQLPNLNSMQSNQELTAEQSAAEDTMAQFVSVVLAETEVVWEKVFADKGMQYEKPSLVLFRGQVQSGCGNAGAESGPFYCPADQKLYIDLSFYEELKNRFNASGDFAMAYVVAHEVGHHMQVATELQADFFAGVWAHYADKEAGIVEPGDIEEALNAASAVGDDNIQKQTRGTIVPDAFTHGTSEQRRTWFYNGYNFGDLDHGNTFDADL